VKVFLDTNVLASAFTTRGLCADVLLLVIEEHELLTGDVVLGELKAVLRRKFGVPTETVSQIEGFLRQYFVERSPKEFPILKLSDNNDVLVVTSALNAGADVLVTGDGEILGLEDKPIKIVNPREFWTLASRRKTKR